jgi:regulator of protease activity HflC (stomatin/prohibitin superfamily)
MLFVLSLLIVVVALIVATRGPRGSSRQAAQTVAVIFALIALGQCATVIPAGHVGVLDIFGSVPDMTLKAGINMRNPLARVIKLSIKTQEIKESMAVPTKEGLSVQLEASCIFHLSPDLAAKIYREVGPNYTDIILVPQFRSVARGVTASYEAKALYTSEREVLSVAIRDDLVKQVVARGVVVENTPLRSIGLPPGLSQSIEEKLKADQESQRMEFVLLREKQEAERKRIEAQGVSDFQKIVMQSISEPLLRWKGIEATEKLAASQNAKIVIVGGRDGLPLILNTEK